jgi:lipoprotein-anchoring transpeptidase ErfK/SrfK
MRAVVAALAIVLAAGCDAAEPPPPPVSAGGLATASLAAQPAQAPSAFMPERERATSAATRGRWFAAQVLEPVRMRATPGGRRLERLRTRTEFGSPKIVSVVRRRPGWLRVLAPERPNHRAGWIPSYATRIGTVDVSIHVDRSRRTLTVRRAGRVVRRLPVAVGRPGTPTPLGRFAVTDRLRTGNRDSPYGCCALALTGHQTKLLAGWPGGDRLAIHATPQPETIGTAASLGCLRASGRHLRALMRIVPLGAPVFIRA